jgi:tetratricopeptide (TPR) repeat protein
VTLAEFFFSRATHPIFGDVPPFAFHQLSRTHFIQGELNVALEEAYKEIELYPDHTNTYYIIGLTLGYLNREEEAIDVFQKFIEYKPTSWAARNDRAWLQFRIGDIDGALLTILPVTDEIYNPWVQNTYGTLLLNKEQYVEAEVALKRAKQVADVMTKESWGNSYPGNDPRVYEVGLQGMRTSINRNLELVEVSLKTVR